MNDKTSANGQGMKFNDILFVLFRHKKKILFLSLVAIAGAAALYFSGSLLPLAGLPAPGEYQSQAQLFIKYVTDSRTPSAITNPDERVRNLDPRGEAVMMTEAAILASWDLALEAAANLITNRPATVQRLGFDPAEVRADQVASEIRKDKRFEISAPKKGSVIIPLTYRHPDAEVVQPVLTSIIEAYKGRHARIHRPDLDTETQMNFQKRELERRLVNIEMDLASAKTNSGIISLDDAKKGASERVARLQQQIADTEVLIDERRSYLKSITESLSAAKAEAQTNAQEVAQAPAIPSREIIDEYRKVMDMRESLRKREHGLLLSGFTPENKLVKELSDAFGLYEKRRLELETDYPGLASASPEARSTARALFDPITEAANLESLESRRKLLNDQLTQARLNLANLANLELKISGLQRDKDLFESSYKTLAASLDRARISKQLEPELGKVVNITAIQEPTPAGRAPSNIEKIALGVLVGGLALAFGLAFVLEFYVDQSVKRAVEIGSKTGLPVFISIPLRNHRGKQKELKPSKNRAFLTNGENGEKKSTSIGSLPVVRHGRVDVAPWDPRHVLQPYYEALRDRTMAFFDLKNLTHKPKLVAITSLGEGAGVSTIAAGLAASLSETGEGHVLLVDMNVQNGTAHKFHKGDLACGIDEALESEARKPAQVNENLFVVSETDNIERLPSAMPQRLRNLMPRLKTSDYDYIIFDMPPVSQVSITPRIARHMDMVYMVAEAEQTDRDTLKRAGQMLADTQTNVAVVLNKTREYMPKSLRQEV